VARCFIRFGTFQLPASRGEDALVAQLTDYTIKHHYPHLAGTPGAPAAFLKEVCERTARLVAGWQSVGFVHGVLNTDKCARARAAPVHCTRADALLRAAA
jgi:uncharacterized protein YdiU (UPF0061 family)